MNNILLNMNLKNVVGEIDYNGYPSLLSINNAIRSLSTFKNGLEEYNTKANGLDSTEIIQLIRNQNHTSIEMDDLNDIIALLKNDMKCIDILKVIKYQQLVPVYDNQKFNNAKKKLFDQNLIETIEVHTRKKHYVFYMLSPIGRLFFMNDSEEIKANFPMLSIPIWIKSVTEDSVLIQAALINIYLSKDINTRYITFNFDECENLLFACEIKESFEVTYHCVMGMNKNEDVKNLQFLNGVVSNKSKININIICVNKNSEKQIKEAIILNSIDSRLVGTCNLEEKYV